MDKKIKEVKLVCNNPEDVHPKIREIKLKIHKEEYEPKEIKLKIMRSKCQKK